MINQCVDFSSRPEMLFNFDQANQQLNITIPQAWLAWHSRKLDPTLHMERRSVAGVLMDYNLFASSYRPHRMAATALILTPMEQPESTRGHGAYAQ
ncbi:hypothetical protein OHD60_03905 [Escherichia coli]|nr:hypothetical protein [Escherichia coli]